MRIDAVWRPALNRHRLSDGKGKFTFPDGKSQDFAVKAGDAMYSAASTHLPENTGDQPLAA